MTSPAVATASSTNSTSMASLSAAASNGPLDSPWGLAIAPTDFGKYAGDLLVGNFGDGTISAFDLAHHDRYVGKLLGIDGKAITIGDLWALTPGNDGKAGSSGEIYFTAGVKDEAQEPSAVSRRCPEPTDLRSRGCFRTPYRADKSRGRNLQSPSSPAVALLRRSGGRGGGREMAAPVHQRIDIAQMADEADAVVAELTQCVGQGMFGGPAGSREQVSGTARAQRDQPVSAVVRGAEHGVGAAQASERDGQIDGGRIGDVASHQGHPSSPKSPQRSAHAPAEVAVPLTDATNPHRQPKLRSVRRHRQHHIEAPAPQQFAQQRGQCRKVKAQRVAVADISRQPSLDRTQAGRSGKNDDSVPHR